MYAEHGTVRWCACVFGTHTSARAGAFGCVVERDVYAHFLRAPFCVSLSRRSLAAAGGDCGCVRAERTASTGSIPPHLCHVFDVCVCLRDGDDVLRWQLEGGET
jgi:hypothetical protein